jgi:hypothetical protein
MQCFFPGFLIPNSAGSNTLNIDMFIESNNHHHTYVPRSYWAKYSAYNQIDIGMRSQVSLGGISFS